MPFIVLDQPASIATSGDCLFVGSTKITVYSHVSSSHLNFPIESQIGYVLDKRPEKYIPSFHTCSTTITYDMMIAKFGNEVIMFQWLHNETKDVDDFCVVYRDIVNAFNHYVVVANGAELIERLVKSMSEFVNPYKPLPENDMRFNNGKLLKNYSGRAYIDERDNVMTHEDDSDQLTEAILKYDA